MSTIKTSFLALVTLLLSACASQPTALPTIPLTPTLTLTHQSLNVSEPMQLQVNDLRQLKYIAIVDSGRNNVDAYQSRQPLTEVFLRALSQQLQSQGVKLVSQNSNKMTIAIQTAQVNVDQSLVKYQMNTALQLSLTVTTSHGKFVKQYSGKASKEAPLEASLEDMQQSMDKLISSVLHDIATDAELNQYLKENL
ncbi:YajG family lipoprotein [Photobacterium damselae]|uniref:YajG family lipoprotein n=1 Tax=Photobacterium damselae TaxID=38293 RepID=UPI0012AE540E|nr:YajG family lipoprotein [Photobacterium damselae]